MNLKKQILKKLVRKQELLRGTLHIKITPSIYGNSFLPLMWEDGEGGMGGGGSLLQHNLKVQAKNKPLVETHVGTCGVDMPACGVPVLN